MLEDKILSRFSNEVNKNDKFWREVNKLFSNDIYSNLNTANLGNLFHYSNRCNYQDLGPFHYSPIMQYELGRKYIKKCKKEVSKLYDLSKYRLEISYSSSQLSSLLSQSLIKKNYNLVTTKQEHVGGIATYLENKKFKIRFFNYKNNNFKKDLKNFKPDILFLSHVLYKSGEIIKVNKFTKEIKKLNDKCIIIVDAAQSFGVLDINFENVDIVFASSHKWLLGPRGKGFLLINKNSLGLFKNITSGSKFNNKSKFELTGGQDFLQYAELFQVLSFFNLLKIKTIKRRSLFLKNYFLSELQSNKYLTNIPILNQHPGFILLKVHKYDSYKLYKLLEKNDIFVKCFAQDSAIRISIPFYETKERLKKNIKVINKILCGKT